MAKKKIIKKRAPRKRASSAEEEKRIWGPSSSEIAPPVEPTPLGDPGGTLLARCDTVESGCSWIKDVSIDLAVFSPPYFSGDGATPKMFWALGKLLHRVLKPGARVFCVMGQISEDFGRTFEARQCILEGAREAGGSFHSWQTIAWVKSIAIDNVQRGHYQPINSDDILNYGYELIFQFSKGLPEDAWPLARLSVGVSFADKSNMKRGSRGKNGDVHCAGDAWFVPYATTGKTQKKGHRHAYPATLVERIIRVAGLYPDSTVLDPFVGGGTTVDVATELGHNVVAVDADEKHIEALIARWPNEPATAPKAQPKRESPAPRPRASVTDGFM